MKARKNPLLAQPPVPAKAHRLGSMIEAEVKRFFIHVDDAAADLYKGVHITPHPVVATAYAMVRRKLDYNDYGFIDVVDPPVLIGFKMEGGEHLDADGYVTAMNIDRLASQLIDDGVTTEDIDEDHDGGLADQYDFAGYSWGPYWAFDSYLGIEYPGGMFGNLPAYGAFVDALQKQMDAINTGELDNDELVKNALQLAYEIVPQTRVCRDVYENEVVAVVVLAPYVPQEEDRNFAEVSSPPFVSLDVFENMEEPEDFDRQLLADGTVVYGDPDKVNRWHGTSLSVAAKALPDIFTPERVEEAREAGSAFDLEELEEEMDEDES